jgi:AFG3 family protein
MLNSRKHGKEISFQSFVWGLLANGLVERVEVVNRTTARVFLRPGANWESINLDNIQHGTQYDDTLNRHDGAEASDIVRDSPSDEAGGIGEPSYPGPDSRSRPGWESPPSSGVAGLPHREAPYYFNIGTVDTFDRKLQAVQEDMGIKPDDFVPVTYVNESNIFAELARHFPTLLLLVAAAFTMRNALGSLGGGIGGRGGIFQVGKANPTVFKAGEAGAPETTFKDVAGLDEAKTEVMEFVDFLKNPARYEKLGAKIPKGALLQGPPGCGKTLLAKATAGEASVPFFSISGSDFIEMFVGVGPSRVRDLFAQARANAPCIVFIDEIDAVGRARGRGGFSGGNDERENTLNALLVEMDGFTSSTGVVVLAGTNRADILDKALLRPGRFDRQITIDKPDMRGRFEIYMVHLQPLKLQADPSFIAKRLAALTPGFAGADIANICNEAALIAARHEKSAVELVDFEQATDRVIGGLEKKNKVISKKEREIVAHHEAGHATAGWFLKHADPLIKVSIIPRGTAALGFAQYLPVDKFLQSRDQLRDFMIMALGGRVAEKLCFGSITTGAQDDLLRVTRAVYAQITNFGMSEKVGKVYFPRAGEAGAGSQFFKPYSERTAEMIDEEAMQMVDEAYQACEKLLAEKLDTVKALAARLLEKEVIGEEDLVEILGQRPFAKPVDYDSFVGRFDADRRKRTGRDNSDKKDPTAKDGATTPPIPVAGVEDNGRADGREADKPGESGRKKPSHVGQDEPIPELA